MTDFEKWINNAHMTDKDSDPTQRNKANPYTHPYTNGAFDLLNSELIKDLLVNAWFAGHETSKYSPNAYGDAKRHAREAIEGLTK